MKYLFLILLVTVNAFAAGNGHHDASIKDLIPPAINFFLLFGFLVFKLKAPVREMFIQKSEKITETLERANVKSKEAQVMLETQQKKIAGLDNEIRKIEETTEKEIQQFKEKYSVEISNKSKKLKEDVALKIDAEKKAMFSEINNKLIDNVIAKTSKIIKGNSNLRSKVNNRIIEELK